MAQRNGGGVMARKHRPAELDPLQAALARAEAAELELARVRSRVARLSLSLLAERLARCRAVPQPRRMEVEDPWEDDG